jgi:hypothetical protein
MSISPSFTLVYTSIREENTKNNGKSPVKVFVGEVSFFGDGNGDPKFLFEKYQEGKPKLLIKTFNDNYQVNCLRYLKTILDIGKNEFRFSPFVYAAPIGYGTFSKYSQSILEIGGQEQVPFMVYVFNENSNDLQKLISVDNKDEILSGMANFDYKRRKAIASRLFELFRLLENLKLQYDRCEQFQIIHYDIKAANYIIDDADNIFIVDLDQSGLFDLITRKFIYRPTCDLLNYDFLLLPYEVLVSKYNSKSKIDQERWEIKEKHTEIWLAWLLIYRVLTGFESPFFFLNTTDHSKIDQFIKRHTIKSLFSKETLQSGDFLNGYIKDPSSKLKLIENIANHFQSAVSQPYQTMMNQVFINGFYEFNLRPSFFRLYNEFICE